MAANHLRPGASIFGGWSVVVVVVVVVICMEVWERFKQGGGHPFFISFPADVEVDVHTRYPIHLVVMMTTETTTRCRMTRDNRDKNEASGTQAQYLSIKTKLKNTLDPLHYPFIGTKKSLYQQITRGISRTGLGDSMITIKYPKRKFTQRSEISAKFPLSEWGSEEDLTYA